MKKLLVAAAFLTASCFANANFTEIESFGTASQANSAFVANSNLEVLAVNTNTSAQINTSDDSNSGIAQFKAATSKSQTVESSDVIPVKADIWLLLTAVALFVLAQRRSV
jgi:hypothetical protein